MRCKNLYTALLLMIFLIISGFNRPLQKNLVFKIDMKIKKVTSYSDLVINCNIKSLAKQGAVIPKIFFFGYEDDYEADIVFELYRYKNQSFSEKQIPTGDYNNLYEKEYETLSYLNTKATQCDLFREYSNFPNGSYRVRAKFIVPPGNHYSKKYIYSNWVYFSVKDMQYPPGPNQGD